MKKVVTAITTTTIALTGAATVDAAEEYEIVKRDTLWGISQNYNMTVEKLMQKNELRSTLIHPGQKLLVNDTSMAKKSDTDTYTVVSGDTLSEIAEEYNVTYQEIMEWNDLPSTLIFPGDKLKITKGATNNKTVTKPKQTKPAKVEPSTNEQQNVVESTLKKNEAKAEKKEVTSVDKEENAESKTVEAEVKSIENESATNNGTYTVAAGDSLSTIASKNNVSFQQLMDWNNLSTTIIFPGQTLAVNQTNAKQDESKENTEVEEKKSQPTEKVESAPTKPEEVKDEVKEQPKEQPKEEAVQKNTTPEPKVEQEQPEKTEQPKQEVEAAPAEDNKTSSESEAKTMTVEATAYTAECEGCTGITATGIDLNADRNKKVIAVDPSVIPLGSTVHVEGYGTAIAGDVGGAIKGNIIDVHLPTRQDAINWGRQQVNIQILD